MKRSIRVISLLLAVLLIALPPLQARAAIGTGTGILIGLAATAVVGSVLAGLGVMPGSDRSVFDGLVDDCIASDAVSPFLDGDGLIQVLRYTNGIGNVRYGVLRNLIEAVRGWIFKEQIVYKNSNSIEVPRFYNTYNAVYSFSDPSCIIAFRFQYSSFYDLFLVAFSDYPATFTSSKNSNSYTLTASTYGYSCVLSSSTSLYGPGSIEFSPLLEFSDVTSDRRDFALNYDFHSLPYLSTYDVSIGSIGESGSDISESYADWSAGSIALPWPGADSGITIPGIDTPGTDEGTDEGTGEDTGEDTGEEEGEKKLVYWPTGIGGSLTDVGSDATTGALTQEGVISGVGTLDDTLTGSLPGTIVGGLTGDVAIDTTVPGEGTEEGEGTGEGTITYPTEIGSYALDLTDFFPFCIPFDIVDFLTLLAAEPEAPYFEFDINFPYMDEPWHVVIDLSAWDNIAALLRTLELLAFIVGLAVVTREKFLRG